MSNISSLGEESFDIELVSSFIDIDGNIQVEEMIYTFSIDISLNQQGFPYDTNSEIKPSPIVLDFLNNNENQILFGDNNGLVHIVDAFGEEFVNDIFPFDTGNQIWGSF